MQFYYLLVVCVLMLASSSHQAPVVSRPSDYNVNVVFENQCASKNDVEEIAKAQNYDLARTVLRTHGKSMIFSTLILL